MAILEVTMKEESLTARAVLVSVAFTRVAAAIKRMSLRLCFEEMTVAMLASIASADFAAASKHIGTLREMIGFAAAIYELETVNKGILLDELSALSAGIRESGKSEAPNIANLFKNRYKADADITEEVESAIQSANESANQLPIELPIVEGVADSIADSETEETRENNAMVSIATAIRQSAILEKIRSLSVRDGQGQMVGCKMKDLLATFPDVSERTIRNDLLRLVNRGSIERIGTGGATTAYVIK